MNRRRFIGASSALILEPYVLRSQMTPEASRPLIPIFDGKTLNGWIQFENSSISFSSASILNPAELRKRLLDSADPGSAARLLYLTDEQRRVLAATTSSDADQKEFASALAKLLNQQITGGSLDTLRIVNNSKLRPETRALLAEQPHGVDLLRLNKLILEDAYPEQLVKSASTGWVVKDGAMASTGNGRGIIYTAEDYSRFRLTFTMRHVSGKPDHQACVLIFCTRPQPGEKPLDALAGIQFQIPNGGHWDYRVGMNQSGGAEFTAVQKSSFDIHSWSRVEILAAASRGIARMAVAQPLGSKAIEVLDFRDPAAGRPGPIALQMHNAGLFDEYKDLAIEVNIAQDELLTTRS